ncbi:hypothetical protein HB016_002554 [Salmonella enterica subsp. enterica]|nr:hypothetical protein [Salmonella enterica]EBQ9479951.1 hypothetical protein [Salmonella enterica subsp. enterica serovar Kokomlemle]ECS5198524.1 hypothetical protein [Salmonella enterica subsp. enterica serovar Poano]EBJ7122016.1 hypothetical protein [Salmonella enterica]ECX4750937.1 hypothetical protein [Salmonella enterica]
MTDVIYPHNQQLYDRRFMNCAERHAIVFLKERREEVDWLLYRSLVSSDEIFRQILQEKKPKYNFNNGCFSVEDFALLGVRVNELRSNDYHSIKKDVDGLIEKQGFVLISGSVFYFDHCPEFRKKHLHHLVVLCGVSEPGNRYDVVDDNPASVLCSYQYNSSKVADFYENNGVRVVRFFTLEAFDKVLAREAFEQRFKTYIKHFSDEQRYYHDIASFLENPFETFDNKLNLLHDGFSLLSGSRNLFAHFLGAFNTNVESISLAQQIAKDAFVLKSLVVKARIMQRMDVHDITSRVEKMRLKEEQLLHALKGNL